MGSLGAAHYFIIVVLIVSGDDLCVSTAYLNSWIGTPHHFLLQGVEEGVVGLLHHADSVCSLAQCEGRVLGVVLADAVNGHEKAAAAALDAEADGLVVGNDDRAYG